MNQGIYFGQLVVGPAGGGKSTYAKTLQEGGATLRRNILIFNLDPAAQEFQYRCDFDIRQLINLQDVMQQMKLGPNGGLIYCFQYLMQNLQWLDQQLSSLGNDDYVIFDCPGQIQLYSHLTIFQDLIKHLQNFGFSLLSVYLVDVSFIQDHNKLYSALLQALAALIALELPALTVLSKCDMVKQKQQLDSFIQTVNNFQQYDFGQVKSQNRKIQMRRAVLKILSSNSSVSLSKLDITNEDSVRDLLLQADLAIQFGQNLEPRESDYEYAQSLMS